MISHIEGTLKKKNPDVPSVEIEVGGIWYVVDLPVFVWRTLETVDVGSGVTFEIYYHVAERQPMPRLIGFTRAAERGFFKKFIEVPNIGPTKATKALVYSVSTVARWIENDDAKSIGLLPGVAARTAKTIIAHLKGKVYEEALLRDEEYDSPVPEPPKPTIGQVKVDVIEALVGLGFQRKEATRLVEEIVRNQALEDAEEIIRAVFKTWAGN